MDAIDSQAMESRERAAKLIKAAKDVLVAEKRAAAPHVDPDYIPASEPLPPQPWSVETLRACLASAHLPEEKVAMLGSTLLPLVWKYTVSLSGDVVNELVKMDIKDIVHLMESADALQVKVEETKEMILNKIKDIPPYVPKIASPPPTAKNQPNITDEAREMNEVLIAKNQPKTIDEAPWEMSADRIAALALHPAHVVPMFFQVGSLPRFQKGTGFFDVSQTCFLRTAEDLEYQD